MVQALKVQPLQIALPPTHCGPFFLGSLNYQQYRGVVKDVHLEKHTQLSAGKEALPTYLIHQYILFLDLANSVQQQHVTKWSYRSQRDQK